MSAASKHTALAFASLALVACLTLAGSAVGGRMGKIRDRQPPSAPTNLRVTATTPYSLSLAWNAASDDVGVAGYYLNVQDGHADGRWTRVPGTSFLARGLACGQSLDVWVTAYDAAGNRSPQVSVTASTAACPDLQAPTTPSGFYQQATTQNAVVLAWQPSSDNVGVVGYGVYRSGLRLAQPTSPSLTLTGLACGSAYQYAVDAVDAAGNRSPQGIAWVQTLGCADSEPPSAPTNLALTGHSSSSLSLSWTASSDNVAVTGYRMLIAGTPKATVTGTSGTLTGLACATTYAIAVDAFDAAGNRSPAAATSAKTDECAPAPAGDTQPPTQPTGLTASSVTETGLVLTWSASSDNVGVTGYDVYRDGSKLATVPGTTSSQSGLACGKSYVFGVLARDAAGNTSTQAQLTASTAPCTPAPDTTPPTQPTGLALSASSATSVTLAWSASSDNVGVVGYGVYRNGALVASPASPGATVSGLACGTAYTFEVDAYDLAGNRSPRASATASTAACADTQAPSAPANVSASSRTATSIALSWSASTDNVGVTGYSLFRGGTKLSTVTGTTGIFSGLACNTNYTLAVDAYDAAGNHSPQTSLIVSTTACADTTPPSAPSGLVAKNVTQTSLDLSWNASSDNVGVTGYDVFRNGQKMTSVAGTAASQSGLACGTSYAFAVSAHDAAGNASAQAQVSASTSACSTPVASGPITISAGGTYTGHWVGDNSGNAVTIATNQPVTIVNSTIENGGQATLLNSSTAGAQITVKNTVFRGTGTDGRAGRALYANAWKSLDLENNTIQGTWGFRMDGAQSGGSAKVLKNKFLNLRSDIYAVHAIQFAEFASVSVPIEIAWNDIRNDFGRSNVEDPINIYNAGAAKIHDNYVEGGYPLSLSGGYSGTGIVVDSSAHDNEIWNNQIVSFTNLGLGLASGYNNKAHDNRIVSDGRDDAGNMFTAANNGLVVWNYDNYPNFTGNDAWNNVSGMYHSGSPAYRNDFWLPNCSGNCTNTSFSGTLDHNAELAERQTWSQKLAANGITVGP